MAWWFGWSPDEIDNLSIDDFLVYQKEAARQIKAGYGKNF
ncbi:GpE family phage tail protein [Neisseria montereyensis]|uniref:GpE family phage tail protein n=1 Tax=Neisseria montereyensis TaxID=2973938 RepID=A0ABT2F9A2_9NEIS|nr:GpE family phage tail protein [Neisseria montereyensis]MCS4532775.1 GpE family phage tail protein [Neisseria montereyensis]